MRILRVTPSYPRINLYGSGSNAYYHTREMTCDTMVLTYFKEGNLVDNLTHAKVMQINAKNQLINFMHTKSLVISLSMKIFFQFKFLFKSIVTLHKYRPNIVHVYTPIPMMVGLYCKLFFSSKVFISLHGTDAKRISESRILAKFMGWTNGILVVSKEMARLPSISRLNTYFMGNGFDENIYKKDDRYIVKDQIINVGNFRWQKNHCLLIKAFKVFLSQYPEFKLLLVGEGPEQCKIEKLVRSLKLNNNVKFLGPKTPNEVNQLLNESKFFVLSSISEGSPKVVLESMATGTPVVSTNVGNVKHLVENIGIIAKENTSDELSTSMMNMLSILDNQLINKTVDQAIQYSWKSVAKRLNLIYKEN